MAEKKKAAAAASPSAAADKRITVLMGDDSAIRKDYIYKYADFNRVDDFAVGE